MKIRIAYLALLALLAALGPFASRAQAEVEIFEQPQSTTVLAGGTATFTVDAYSFDDDDVTYQWLRLGANIPGATGETLTLTNVKREDTSKYSVRVSDSLVSEVSASAQLTVTEPGAAPTILAQPRNQTVAQGANVTLSVTAQGASPLSYQWKRFGADLPGANSATLTFSNIAPASSDSYSVVVSNSLGSVTSITANLSVNATPVPPVITSAPRGESVAVGGVALFNATASGSQPLSYQWFKDGQPLSGQNASQLRLSGVAATDAGNYTVAVTNTAATVTSGAAALSIADSHPDDANTWTILVYGHGDHSLSGSLIQDMLEMEKVGSGPGFNIVVQTDFNSSRTDLANILPADTLNGGTRFLMQPNLDSPIKSQIIQRLPELDQDDPANLTDFVKWGITNYPAQRFGLILWDHGGQFLGFGGDEQDGTRFFGVDAIKTDPIKTALETAIEGTSVSKFDFVSFDTCLMGGAEILGDFTTLTDTFIACPEIDYGAGWDYTATLDFLKRNPGVSSREFARAEVEKWNAHHFTVGGGDLDTMLGAHVAYDLTSYPAFESAFHAFAPLMKQFATGNITRLIDIRRATTRYSVSNSAGLNSATDYTDLGELAQKMADEPLSPPALKTAADALVSSINNMIINKALGTQKQNALGLSVHLPLDGRPYNGYSPLNIFTSDQNWPEIFPIIKDAKALDLSAPAVTPVGGTARSVSRGEKTGLSFQVEEATDLHRINGYIVSRDYTDDANELVYLGQIYTADDTVGLDGEFSWDGAAPFIWGADFSNGLYLGGFTDPSGPDIVTSYAEYLPPNHDVSQFVIITTDMSGDNPQIISVLDGEVEDLAPRGIELEPGGLLTPVYYTEYEDPADPESFESYSILADDSLLIPADGLSGMEVAWSYLQAGDYTVSMQAEDDFGNVSEAVEFTVTIAPEPLSLELYTYPDGYIELSWYDSYGDTTLETDTDLNSWDFYIPNDYIDFEGDLRYYGFFPEDEEDKRSFYRVTRPE
ncbi:immunoglobulin domain-containing protein [Verrucomicrobiaceae bacterium 227]